MPEHTLVDISAMYSISHALENFMFINFFLFSFLFFFFLFSSYYKLMKHHPEPIRYYFKTVCCGKQTFALSIGTFYLSQSLRLRLPTFENLQSEKNIYMETFRWLVFYCFPVIKFPDQVIFN